MLSAHMTRMYDNRDDPVELILCFWSLICTFHLIVLVDRIRRSGITPYQRWLVFRRSSLVVAASIIYLAIKTHRTLPYWCAVVCWLCAFNVIALGSVIVVFVDDNATMIFPELSMLGVSYSNTTP
jgi:hypothetical protein